jgi:hypothetical protein
MNRILILLVATVALTGCDAILGDDPTPETIRYQVQGDAGAPVQILLSKEFVSGVTEAGVTEVSLFVVDTLDTVLPVEGDYDISLERRFFIQVLPLDTLATVNGRVIVDVDGRNVFNRQGTLPVDPPFRYVYVFNQATTRVIELF